MLLIIQQEIVDDEIKHPLYIGIIRMTLHQTGARQRIGRAFLGIDDFKGRTGVDLIDRLKGQSQADADLALNEQLDRSAAGFRKTAA